MAVGDRLFYYPTKHVYGLPESHGLDYESVFFNGTDGVRLHGWFFPAVGQARGTVLHCHGNAGNITGHFEHVKWLPAARWNVFCFDYRGYGQSSGQPTRAGTIADALAAAEYVHSRDDVAADRVVVLGQSLGGAVGIVLAAKWPGACGLAVEGAFSHYRQEAAFVCRQNIFMRPVAGIMSRALISEGFDPIDWVSKLPPQPKLFVCGTDDRIVDHRQTVALHDAAGAPKELFVMEGGGHADSMCLPEGQARFLKFFERCVGGSSGDT
ncbi:MAG: alpha/beta hydrolase [Phycisphaerae bacterium]